MEPPCACSWRPHQHAREVPHPHAHEKAHEHAPDGLMRTCAWSLREHYHSKEICVWDPSKLDDVIYEQPRISETGLANMGRQEASQKQSTNDYTKPERQ